MSVVQLANKSGGGRTPNYSIGAHADYRPSDYLYARTQSLQMRDTPWESRIKPLPNWRNYGIQALTVAAAVALTFTLV
ncbi:MAG TPA: hypothetical protein VHL34_03640 [Rhizomicrobium sp.]|jgi:hypothetical protein|nr:hypothetical protein [Rhizomicrobium sp.]